MSAATEPKSADGINAPATDRHDTEEMRSFLRTWSPVKETLCSRLEGSAPGSHSSTASPERTLPRLLGHNPSNRGPTAGKLLQAAGDLDDCISDPEVTLRYDAILRQAHKRWTEKDSLAERLRCQLELAWLMEQTRAQMLGPLGTTEVQGGHRPANRYGPEASLPPFVKGSHVPTLALINPNSGAMAGCDILSIARRTPYYQSRFFNIIDVVRDRRRGGLMDVFRAELILAKEEAKAMGTRARVVSGGGDGTASFALFILLAALRADNSRDHEGLADSGNGFIWSDEELASSFPALAQMPLGSANDFGFTLGWGQKYPGAQAINTLARSRACNTKAEGELRDWIEAVISPASRVVNFDIWGIMPPAGQEKCDFKLCELSGRRGADPRTYSDGQRQLMMKEAGLPVPLFLCLYFSAGFGAYMTARFQLNRRTEPLHNRLEYARQAMGIIAESVPPQLNPGLEGVQLICEGEQYFPPRKDRGNSGKHYREVGFLNINRQAGMAQGAERAHMCGRVCSTREPAKFNDGRMDMYRLKLTSVLKNPGFKWQTDKKDGTMSMRYTGGRGKGIFFQWDGEARFAFSPSGDAFSINIRKIMNVPVVLGPLYDHRRMGDPDNWEDVRFSFAGQCHQEIDEARLRVLRYVCGELDAELNATREEIRAAGFQCQ